VAAYRELFPRLIVLEYEVAVRGLVPLREGQEIPAGHLRGKRVLAVSGIARPGRFTDLLKALDAGSVEAVEFPDHYAYPGKGRARITAAVRRASPDIVVTTEKDAVKLDDGRDDPFAGTPAYFLRIGLDLPEELFAAAAAAVRRFEERRG
jgi:tetraacyldisaccharide-1-P 4'-kinase